MDSTEELYFVKGPRESQLLTRIAFVWVVQGVLNGILYKRVGNGTRWITVIKPFHSTPSVYVQLFPGILQELHEAVRSWFCVDLNFWEERSEMVDVG